MVHYHQNTPVQWRFVDQGGGSILVYDMRGEIQQSSDLQLPVAVLGEVLVEKAPEPHTGNRIGELHDLKGITNRK